METAVSKTNLSSKYLERLPEQGVLSRAAALLQTRFQERTPSGNRPPSGHPGAQVQRAREQHSEERAVVGIS